MTTETQTAGTATTAAAAEPAPHTMREVFDTGKAAAIARVEAMRAERAQAGQQAAGDTSGQASGEQTGEQSTQDASQEQAQTTEAGAAGTEATQETTAAEPSDEDKAAQALLVAARENRALIEERKRLARRDAELKEREAKLVSTVIPERETVARLVKAREAGDPIEVLRAAGYSEEDLGNFALSLIDGMGKLEAKPAEKPAPRPPTAEEVAALVRKQAEDEAKAKADAEAARLQTVTEQRRNEYFAGVGSEFKANAKAYPVLSALRPSFGQLETAFVEHFQKTGERLTPPQLLGMLEKEYGGRGLTVAPKKPAATTVATATSKTITPKATSDAGAVTVRDEGEAQKPKSLYELNEEGKRAAMAKLEQQRAAKKAQRAAR